VFLEHGRRTEVRFAPAVGMAAARVAAEAPARIEP